MSLEVISASKSKQPYTNLQSSSTKLPREKSCIFNSPNIYLEGSYTSKTIGSYIETSLAQKGLNSSYSTRREFLLTGASNSGKSSLVNKLFNNKVAVVSNTPVLAMC